MTKLEVAARQALEALEYSLKWQPKYSVQYSAITALREALVGRQAIMKECRHCGFLCKPNDNKSGKWYPLEQAERVTEGNGSEVSKETEAQEPVAEVVVRPLRGDQSQPTTDIKWLQRPATGKLYAAPVRTKDLTYGEVVEIIKDLPFNNSRVMDAMAVIKAYQGKKK